MNTQKQQESTTQFLARMRAAIDESAVRPADLLSVVKSLMAYFQARFDALFSLIQSNEQNTKATFSTVQASITSLKSSVKSLETALNTKKGKVELEKDLRDIWDQIGNIIETMPTEYDDEAVQNRLNEFATSLAAIQTRLDEPEEDDEDEEEYVTREEFEAWVVSAKSSKSQPANMPPPDYGPFHESFSMNGATTSVSLQRGIGAQGTAVMVRYQGQMLDLGDQYTVDGNQIALQFTPANGTTISVTYWSN